MKNPTTIVLLIISSIITLGGVAYLYLSPNHLWGMITGVATVWLVFIAYWQLAIANITSKAEFICRFSEGFFMENTRDLIMLLENKALTCQLPDITSSEDQEEKDSCFIINIEIVKKLYISPKKENDLIERERYSVYEIDDWLLGPLEDVGYFEKSGLISVEQAYNGFSWYVDVAGKKGGPIMKYVEYSQKEDKDVYENFIYLKEKLKSYEREKKQ